MRKTLVFGLVALAAIAGTVFAARPGNTPPNEAVGVPAGAEKPAGAARPDAGRANEPAKPKKLTTGDVVKLWTPKLKGATDYHNMGGEPEQSNVAAYSFRVVGVTFEEMWKHYAKLCGVTHEYKERRILISASTGPNGPYVVSERVSEDGKRRTVSVFMLKTDAYTVTVTFQPDQDGKSIIGSLSVVLP